MPCPQIQPLETLGQIDCHDFQECHSPTQLDLIVEIPDPRLRPKTYIVRRRVLDSQIWRNLTDEQQRSAERIERGFKLVCAGLGSKGQDFSPFRGGISATGDLALRCYSKWLRQCSKERLPVHIALGILVEGRTLYSYAKEYHCRRASISVVFAALLDAYTTANGGR